MISIRFSSQKVKKISIPTMQLSHMCVLVFIMLALTQADDIQEASSENDQTVNSNLVKRSVGCGGGWTTYHGRCYYYVSTAMSWPRAERYCQHLGGNLASVHNSWELRVIQNMILRRAGYNRRVWIGGSDAQGTDHWFWTDGRPFHYTSWCSESPTLAV
ncbi:galactose-specific lectin nattectin-like [Pholidichthys leucotaenia]